MVCRNFGGVIACGPPPGVYRRRILYCPACERRRRFIERWDGAWYGSTQYCACGDYFQEDWMGTRPFERGWRKKAQEQFRAMWNNAASSENYERYVRADQSFALSRNWRKADRKRAFALELIRRERVA